MKYYNDYELLYLISEEDEVSLITPKNNHRKIEGKIITNLFTKFLSNNKEEKND